MTPSRSVMRRRWKNELEFNIQWGDLATYNSEVARGLVHTPEWQAQMAEKQERYNREVLGHA